MTIAPRQTVYHGECFRSALEARWAVFFDAIGVVWNYEPATYKLSSGWYIPDFHIKWAQGDSLWVEVKPGMWDVSDHDRARFSEFDEPLVILDGVPEPRPYKVWGSEDEVVLTKWGPRGDPASLVHACRKAATTRFRRKH